MSHTVESRRMRGSRGCDDVKHKKSQKSSRSPQKSLRNRFAIRHAVGFRGAYVSLQKFVVVIGKVSFQHDSFSLRFVPRLLICRKRTCYELLFKPENSIGIKIKPEFIGAMKKLLYKFFFQLLRSASRCRRKRVVLLYVRSTVVFCLRFRCEVESTKKWTENFCCDVKLRAFHRSRALIFSERLRSSVWWKFYFERAFTSSLHRHTHMRPEISTHRPSTQWESHSGFVIWASREAKRTRVRRSTSSSLLSSVQFRLIVGVAWAVLPIIHSWWCMCAPHINGFTIA